MFSNEKTFKFFVKHWYNLKISAKRPILVQDVLRKYYSFFVVFFSIYLVILLLVDIK